MERKNKESSDYKSELSCSTSKSSLISNINININNEDSINSSKNENNTIKLCNNGVFILVIHSNTPLNNQFNMYIIVNINII